MSLALRIIWICVASETATFAMFVPEVSLVNVGELAGDQKDLMITK